MSLGCPGHRGHGSQYSWTVAASQAGQERNVTEKLPPRSVPPVIGSPCLLFPRRSKIVRVAFCWVPQVAQQTGPELEEQQEQLLVRLLVPDVVRLQVDASTAETTDNSGPVRNRNLQQNMAPTICVSLGRHLSQGN